MLCKLGLAYAHCICSCNIEAAMLCICKVHGTGEQSVAYSAQRKASCACMETHQVLSKLDVESTPLYTHQKSIWVIPESKPIMQMIPGRPLFETGVIAAEQNRRRHITPTALTCYCENRPSQRSPLSPSPAAPSSSLCTPLIPTRAQPAPQSLLKHFKRFSSSCPTCSLDPFDSRC